MDCIKRCWDVDFYRGVYSCPTCRTTFNQRPALSRSTVLAGILGGMKQKVPARPVTCDVCKGRKVKAIQSCLVCMASYCQTHVRPHYESKAFKIHKLVKASPILQHQICPQHHKALAAVENSDRIFTEIIRSIQNIQAEVREKIRAQKNKEVRDAENHIQMLEQEIVKLQKENCKVEPLLRTENHVYFFKVLKKKKKKKNIL
ncbi:hypothetical protein PO909_019025 [Leuciscus waleckii]